MLNGIANTYQHAGLFTNTKIFGLFGQVHVPTYIKVNRYIAEHIPIKTPHYELHNGKNMQIISISVTAVKKVKFLRVRRAMAAIGQKWSVCHAHRPRHARLTLPFTCEI